MTRRGFVLRFEAAVEALAHEAAQALATRLREHPGARIEAGPRAVPGTTMIVGVRDDDGEPRWLAPIPVRDAPPDAAEDALAFLERWGFLPRQRLARSDSKTP